MKSEAHQEHRTVIANGCGRVKSRPAPTPVPPVRRRLTPALTRHLGPTAQDFHAAFNVRPDDWPFTTVDADGVALAAIQGLDQKVHGRRQRSGAAGWRRSCNRRKPRPRN
jgi:hypothetical protein